MRKSKQIAKKNEFLIYLYGTRFFEQNNFFKFFKK